jgi:hypothetical protein
MKKLVIAFFLATTAVPAGAQTFEEWWRQKDTQKKYLAEQIAALQVYISTARKGYDIAQKGLTTIGNIKDGDFNLHRDFFRSLSDVSPAVDNYVRVADIISLQVKTVRSASRGYQMAKASEWIRPGELDYIQQVYGRLADDCIAILSELQTLITDNRTDMRDDERLQRIDGIYGQMSGNYRFAEAFGWETQLLAISRNKEANEIDNLRLQYGTNKD